MYASNDRSLIYEKEFKPRGLRQDIAMFIFTQLTIVPDQVDVELQETAFPDKHFKLSNISLKKGDGTFVVFKDGNLSLAGAN